MGKSPGKWIKTVLFGKKSSKSNISKAREKLVKQKEGPIDSKASEAEFSFDPTPITFARNERDPGLENKVPENLMLPNQVDIAGPGHQDATPDPDRIMQEEAATGVQAILPADPEKIKQEEAATRAQATLPADPEKIKQEEAATMVQATLPADPEKIKQEEAATMMQATLPVDLDKIKQEEAAMKVQATLRGYLACRAFRSLKGIIRLQAHIRGHLVRRQAVSTLCCMYGIIKLQALVRGQRVRQSDVVCEMHDKCNLGKPLVDKCGNSAGLTAKLANTSANIFIHKLLPSSTATTVLRIQYGSGNPNSVLSWLERWSASLFWKPVPKPKKLLDSKSQRKLVNISNGDAQMSKPKRGNWKIPSTSSELVLVQENSDFEKPNRSMRKVSSKHTDPVQENSENEFEKVKRNLRKVHTPVVVNSAQSEVESETVKRQSEKVAVTTSYGVLEEEAKSCTNEKTKMDQTLAMSNELDEVTLRISVSREPSNLPGTQLPINSVPLRENTSRCENNSGEEATKELKDSRGSCNDENSLVTNGHLSLKEDSPRNEDQKHWKSPVLAKQELLQDALQNNSPTPTLPSYMAATESAKAKLRAQGSPRLGQDSGGERSNSTRRHSLPSSNTSKISSHSPRTQRPAQAGVKGGHKSDRTVGSSRGGNGKLTQAGWRR